MVVGLHGEDGPVRHQVLGGVDLLLHLLEHWTDGRTLLHTAPPVNTSSTIGQGVMEYMHSSVSWWQGEKFNIIIVTLQETYLFSDCF